MTAVLILKLGQFFLDILKLLIKSDIWVCCINLSQLIFIDLSNLMECFCYRYKGDLLNGQSSKCHSIKAGVSQELILGPLLLLIYINDLSEGITSNVKLFADDTSIFSTAYNISILTSNLNSDLQKVS